VMQDQVARAGRQRRHEAGALTFQTTEFRPVVTTEGHLDLRSFVVNRATQLIEDFMIAANQATIAFLEAHDSPSVRRIVRIPKRWDRIRELAIARGTKLPAEPNAKPLEEFLRQQQRDDPDRFPDLSLSVIKLLGRGEYVVQAPHELSPGHFGLAVENYTHSTAPNRRYPDILTQRLLLASLEGRKSPYALGDLQGLAQRCTMKEDDANKVERAVRKSIAAVALAPRIGQEFPGFITGVSDKGVWVRIIAPPVEGKLESDVKGVDVGDKVRVRLVATNPQRGYIDFRLVRRE
jgi:ribonuclease R